ncbi:cell wall protein [Streptomyces mirabilis]|uniref:cell wall protein n=1 Tax=Streptomyces mirabilis TaxID=68239 RepID=UPI000B14E012
MNVRIVIRRLAVGPAAGLAWLAWRQHRVAHWTALALAALAAIWGVWQHGQLVGAVESWATNCPHGRALGAEGPSVCDGTPRAVSTVMTAARAPLRFLPVAVGALLGAPLFAQTLKDGTHRLVWTQSVSRRQWAAAKLCVTGAVTVVAALLITAPVTWWWSTIRHGRTATGPLGTAWRDTTPQSDWSYLPYTGPAGIAHLLLALATGAAVGLLLRRVLAAVAVSAAVALALQTGLEKLRPHLLTPTVRRTDGDAFPDWTLNAWHLDQGYTHADGSLTATSPCPPSTTWEALQRCEHTRHITGTYSRDLDPQQFLPLQWIETWICLTATALLAAFCLVHVRRMRAR